MATRSFKLGVALAAVSFFATSDMAMARHKKPRHAARSEPLIARDYDGTPIIMRGFPARRQTAPVEEQPMRDAKRPVQIPRGSSTYIPPPNPSPNATNSPPPAMLLQKSTEPYTPPPTNSYSDRVITCIHSYPLQGGIGNNPSDQQMYIRQCANQ